MPLLSQGQPIPLRCQRGWLEPFCSFNLESHAWCHRRPLSLPRSSYVGTWGSGGGWGFWGGLLRLVAPEPTCGTSSGHFGGQCCVLPLPCTGGHGKDQNNLWALGPSPLHQPGFSGSQPHTDFILAREHKIDVAVCFSVHSGHPSSPAHLVPSGGRLCSLSTLTEHFCVPLKRPPNECIGDFVMWSVRALSLQLAQLSPINKPRPNNEKPPTRDWYSGPPSSEGSRKDTHPKWQAIR